MSASDSLLDPLAAHTDSVLGGEAVLAAMLRCEAALARASGAVGVLDPALAQQLSSCILAFPLPPSTVREIGQRGVLGGNPIIPTVQLVRAHVRTHLGADAAAAVHRGATSQDMLDSALMLLARDTLDAVLLELMPSMTILGQLAETHRDTLCVARTLTQFSVPISFGLRAARWLERLRGAAEVLLHVRRSLPAQLSGASGTLASFHELGRATLPRRTADSPAPLPPTLGEPGAGRHLGEEPDIGLALLARFSAELGLADPGFPWHVDRQPVTRLGDALSQSMAALGGLANDLLFLGRSEVGEVRHGHPPGGGGSSAMPHKANPVRAVLLRAGAQRAPALAAELHRSAALTVDERPDGAWHAEWPSLLDLLRVCLGAHLTAHRMLTDLEVLPERMHATAAHAGPAILSERLTLALMPRLGLPGTQEALREVQRLHRLRPAEDAAVFPFAGATALAEVYHRAGLQAPGAEELARLLDPRTALGSGSALITRALRRAQETQAQWRAEARPRGGRPPHTRAPTSSSVTESDPDPDPDPDPDERYPVPTQHSPAHNSPVQVTSSRVTPEQVLPRLSLTDLGGPHAGPPLVLGPSLGTTVRLWSTTVPLLAAAGYRVLGWDLPGHGSSPGAPAPFTVATLAAALHAELTAAGIPRAVCAGVSLGGAVTLQLALDFPEQVWGAAVLCSGAVIGTPDSWHERATQVRAASTSSLVIGSATRWFSEDAIARVPELTAQLLHDLQRVRDEDYARCCEALAQFDVRDRLGGLAAPLLALWGSLDSVIPPSSARELAAQVPHGRVAEVRDAAHLAPAEHPQAVAHLLLDWAASLEGAPA